MAELSDVTSPGAGTPPAAHGGVSRSGAAVIGSMTVRTSRDFGGRKAAQLGVLPDRRSRSLRGRCRRSCSSTTYECSHWALPASLASAPLEVAAASLSCARLRPPMPGISAFDHIAFHGSYSVLVVTERRSAEFRGYTTDVNFDNIDG